MAGLSPCAWRGIQPLEGFRSARLGLNIDHRLEYRRGVIDEDDGEEEEDNIDGDGEDYDLKPKSFCR